MSGPPRECRLLEDELEALGLPLTPQSLELLTTSAAEHAVVSEHGLAFAVPPTGRDDRSLSVIAKELLWEGERLEAAGHTLHCSHSREASTLHAAIRDLFVGYRFEFGAGDVVPAAPRLRGDCLADLDAATQLELLRRRPRSLPAGEMEIDEFEIGGVGRIRVEWINGVGGAITGDVSFK